MGKIPTVNIFFTCLLVAAFALSSAGIVDCLSYKQLYIGYGTLEDGWLANHLFFSFFHANVFHLIGNILCLLMMKGRMHVVADLSSAVAASFLPVVFIPALSSLLPVCGFSAVLFAEVGIRFGIRALFWRMIKSSLPFFVAIFFVPKIVIGIHLYAMIIGFFVGLWVYRKR